MGSITGALVDGVDLRAPRTQQVEVRGGRVAFDVIGSGPPVVLTHGSPSWSYIWRDVAPRLAATRTVYLWDLLGYGGSFPNTSVRPSIALHAETLAELTDLWGLDRPALVGHDIGGGATLRAHLLNALPVRALVILDAAVFPPWIGPGTAHMQEHLPAYRTMPNGMFQQVIRAHLAETTHRPMEETAARAYLDLYATREGQQRWLERTAGFTESDTTEFLPLLPTITVPTSIIWGQEDGWLPPELGRRLAAAVPGSHFELVPRAGHFITEDAPARVAELLEAALQ